MDEGSGSGHAELSVVAQHLASELERQPRATRAQRIRSAAERKALKSCATANVRASSKKLFTQKLCTL